MSAQEFLSELKRQLEYFPATGRFKWLISPSSQVRKGRVAGTVGGTGYRQIGINGQLHYAHRLAWLYTHGVFPKTHIDHINRVRDDNRLINLREATDKQNCENAEVRSDNKSGVRGVHQDKRTKKWIARIGHNGIVQHLGCFTVLAEAAAAYEAAAAKLFTHYPGA